MCVPVLQGSDVVHAGGSGSVPSHESVLGWRPVGEAREGSGCLPDAAGHSQGLGAEGGGDGQVGELGVKVPQVCGARLWNGWKRALLHYSVIGSFESTSACSRDRNILLGLRGD